MQQDAVKGKEVIQIFYSKIGKFFVSNIWTFHAQMRTSQYTQQHLEMKNKVTMGVTKQTTLGSV